MAKSVDIADIVTAQQAAKIIGRNPSTVYWYRQQGMIQAYRVPGRRAIYFLKSDVEKLAVAEKKQA